MLGESKSDKFHIDPELIYKTIREEILDQKRCQFQLLSLAVTVTALILAYASTNPAGPSIYIAPLVMNVLAIVIIFDKAVSFQRKVGYLQILERYFGTDILMWESNLDIFRKMAPQEKKRKKMNEKEADPPRKQSYMTTVGILLTALNSICIYLFIIQVVQGLPNKMSTKQWITSAIICALFIYGIVAFLRKRHQLIRGQHSGPQIRKTWEVVLKKLVDKAENKPQADAKPE